VNGLKYLIWLCTRAEEESYIYSLGEGKAREHELNTEEAKGLLKMAGDFGVEYLFITGGGEPFMRPDILELIRYASSLGLKPYIKTNGYSINRDVAKELAKNNCQVIVSIAGMNKVDDWLRGKNAHKRSIDGALTCSKENILYSLSVINTKYVVNQIRDLVYLAQEVGSRGFSLAALIPQPICVDKQMERLKELEPTPEEHEQELNQIYALSKELNGKIRLLAYDIFYNRILKTKEPQLKLRSRCSLCHNLEDNHWLEVHDDGTFYGCSSLEFKVGHLKEDTLGKAIERIRNSPLVKRLSDPNNLKGKCKLCEFNRICGGCRARAFIYTGDMFASDPLCPYKPKEGRYDV
jgi:radical SAM protein with 4Fe4S-binding SPASM domain